MISFRCSLSRPGFDFDVAFEAGDGVTALFGQSGSGKSTVIRLLSGLDRPDSGRILMDGEVLLDTAARQSLPTHRRRMGLVFQDSLLFPHLSVRSNLTYAQWFTPRRERTIGFDPVIAVLGIGHLLDRMPSTLSGGERQRVAIGRALLASPRLLLMDEPLASLDTARKLEILPFIEALRDDFGIPIVYVSHSVEEIARLATQVVRLENGRVVASGAPVDVLAPVAVTRPADRFEAVSMVSAPVKAFLADYGMSVLAHPAGDIYIPGRIEPGRTVRLAIRATNVTLALGRPGNVSIRTVLQGEVERFETDDGPFAHVVVALRGGERLQVYTTRLAADELGLGPGDSVHALIKAVAVDERGVPGLRPASSWQSPNRT